MFQIWSIAKKYKELHYLKRKKKKINNLLFQQMINVGNQRTGSVLNNVNVLSLQYCLWMLIYHVSEEKVVLQPLLLDKGCNCVLTSPPLPEKGLIVKTFSEEAVSSFSAMLDFILGD